MNIQRRGPGSLMCSCDNSCRKRDGEKRSATHVAVMIGYETPLCAPCAAEWERIWSEALGRDHEPTVNLSRGALSKLRLGRAA